MKTPHFPGDPHFPGPPPSPPHHPSSGTAWLLLPPHHTGTPPSPPIQGLLSPALLWSFGSQAGLKLQRCLFPVSFRFRNFEQAV